MFLDIKQVENGYKIYFTEFVVYFEEFEEFFLTKNAYLELVKFLEKLDIYIINKDLELIVLGSIVSKSMSIFYTREFDYRFISDSTYKKYNNASKDFVSLLEDIIVFIKEENYQNSTLDNTVLKRKIILKDILSDKILKFTKKDIRNIDIRNTYDFKVSVCNFNLETNSQVTIEFDYKTLEMEIKKFYLKTNKKVRKLRQIYDLIPVENPHILNKIQIHILERLLYFFRGLYKYEDEIDIDLSQNLTLNRKNIRHILQKIDGNLIFKNTNLNNNIKLEILVNSPIEKVWKYWTDKEYIKQWNIPFENWHCPYVENNLIVGGNFCYRMEDKFTNDGFDYVGKYDQIIYLKKIESTCDKRKNIVTFEKIDDNLTLITETYEPEEKTELSLQKQFTSNILSRFKEFIEKSVN